MHSEPQFQLGDRVLLKSTKQFGTVEREPTLDGGEYWYRVRFERRVEHFEEGDLEKEQLEETLESIVLRGSWGNLQAFRTSLTVERILHTNQNTLYSFRSQRVLFEPFQYRPLIKILESPDRRLLIADEVGLGKTIEAGLILTELEARNRHATQQGGRAQPLNRVLVVCPSRLREKWRDELHRKFGCEFEIYNRHDLETYLARIRRNPASNRLRAVVSMQTVRSSEFREQLMAELDGIDLLIVDEAHHARNSYTQTADMLRDLCEAASAVLLLTATPLHLANRDLFTLLHALRPTEFRDANVLDERLRDFRGVHEAGLHVRRQTAEGLAEARRILEAIFAGTLVKDPDSERVIEDLGGALPTDAKSWVELERRVQDIHPLASVLTRTRKRDVQEFAAVRRADTLTCRWTEEEERAYKSLVEGATGLGWFNGPAGIGQIQRARQAASCLPAALEARSNRILDDDDSADLMDILPSELTDTPMLGSNSDRTTVVTSISYDSKFEELLKLLNSMRAEHRRQKPNDPEPKILIFTYFVGTSKYLARRLSEAGYPALRIAGDVPSDPKHPDRDIRSQIMTSFREDPAVLALVSTEVGSEGLDFQFCHQLVNYDLPWNPMVVEQRIGRIDRFGQESKVVRILNLVVEGSVEHTILARLYKRIGIFEESIGQLESILGDEIRSLQRDYVSGNLLPKEAERRAKQAEYAIAARKESLEELERKAGNLFGHEQYLRDQLAKVGRLGRYISARAMLAVIESFLQSRHPSVRIQEEPRDVYRLRLTEELKMEIQNASDADNPWEPGRLREGILTFCFDGTVAYQYSEYELLNASHPFITAAVKAIERQLSGIHTRTTRATLHVSSDDGRQIRPGYYFVLTFSQTVEGLRSRKELDTIAWPLNGTEQLSAESAERLLHLVQEQGVEPNVDASSEECVSPEIWSNVEREIRRRCKALRVAEEQESASRYVKQMNIVEAEYRHELAVRERRLQTARDRDQTRVIPLHEAQIAKTKFRFQARREEIEHLKNVRCSFSDPIAACLVHVITTTSDEGTAP